MASDSHHFARSTLSEVHMATRIGEIIESATLT
jgi:hypothetical protein